MGGDLTKLSYTVTYCLLGPDVVLVPMEEHPDSEDQSHTEKSTTRDELRTIGFRLREIQRLLSMRVKQENRRLEAEGIAPVTEATFFKRTEGERVVSEDATRYLIETLAGLDLFEEARVILADGTTVEGRVNPITYTPNERIRLKIRPRDEDTRYELRAVYSDEQWSTPVLRRHRPDDDDWTELGKLDTLRTLGE